MLIKEKHIILSLDDFGISRKANDNILRFLNAGEIDRISIMTHGIISQEEIGELLSSDVKLDIHLDLKNEINPSRKLSDSAIRRIFIFLADSFSGKITPVKMEKQWDGQIRYFQKIFLKSPDGINSHEHIHFFPPYFKTVLKLSKKYGINYIRLGKEPYKGKSLVSLILDWLRKINLKSFNESGMDSSDITISFDWINNFNDFLENCPKNKAIEMIFHPERDEEMLFLEKIKKA